MKFVSLKNGFRLRFDKYGYHFVFSIAIILLLLLSIWWTVFINVSIEKLRFEKYKNIRQTLNYYALKIYYLSKKAPPLGEFSIDKRFEIKKVRNCTNKFQIPINSKWKDYKLVFKQGELLNIEKDYKSKKFMVSGESKVLLFVILISILFLYISVRNEKRTSKEIKDFFERITHEIKTPITGIKALLQSIKSGAIDNKSLINYIDLALIQINRQEKLSENILAGAFLKSGENMSKCEIIDINDYIKKYFENYSYLEANVKLNIKYLKEKYVKVYANTYYLKVIFDNLIDNAIKYSNSNLILEITLEISIENITIIIRDNGPGINKQTSKLLFEAYKSTKQTNNNKNKGSGIGLNISMNMAKKMKGNLSYKSIKDNKGSEFHLTLMRLKKDDK